MIRHPSVDTIEAVCKVDRATAIKVRRVIDGRDKPTIYPRTAAWEQACFHPPRRLELVIEAVDELLDTYGTEAIRAEGEWDNYRQDIVAVYANAGDSYAGTMLYDYERGVWYATSTADWIETAERNGRYRFR